MTTAIATSNPSLQTVNVQLTEQIQLPVALRPVPTQAELTQNAAERVMFAGLSGVTGAGGIAGGYFFGTVAVNVGQPLITSFATQNPSDPMTWVVGGGAVLAGALAAYGTFSGVRHLVNGAKAALGLGKFDLLPEGKTHPNLEGSYAGLTVTARTLATEALAAAGTGIAAAGLLVATAPASLYAYAAGAAALVASYFTGRSAVQKSVGWATNMLQSEVQLRISHALEAAVQSGEIPLAALEAPTPDQQPAARPVDASQS